MKNLYQGYLKAMGTKASLDEERFYAYIDRDDVIEIKDDNASIFGLVYEFDDDYIFVPTHIAYNSRREGLRLVKYLLKKYNILFAVTFDVAKVLIKIGYKLIDFGPIKRDFHGKQVNKYLLVSNDDLKNIIFENSDIFEKMTGLTHFKGNL